MTKRQQTPKLDYGYYETRIRALKLLDYSNVEIASLINKDEPFVRRLCTKYDIKSEPNMTFEEIGKELGISKTHVTRLYKSALEKMRKHLNNDELLVEYFTECLQDLDNPHLPPITFEG